VNIVTIYLLYHVIYVWETLLALCPELELVTKVLAPSIGEAPAEDTNDVIKILAPLSFSKSPDYSSLDEAVDRKDRILTTLIK
jgi:hypothetical protein